MMLEYYKYSTVQLKCKKCNWTGLGEESVQGEIFEELYEINCPSCSEKLATILFPTSEEMLKYGTDEEKEQAKENIEFQKAIEKSLLKSIDELPEIEDDKISFEVIEKSDDNYDYLNVLWKGKVIWEEIIGYEYHYRFIELGKMFKDKYGSKMVDFIPKGDGYFLYGDNIQAPKKIEEFRGSLK